MGKQRGRHRKALCFFSEKGAPYCKRGEALFIKAGRKDMKEIVERWQRGITLRGKRLPLLKEGECTSKKPGGDIEVQQDGERKKSVLVGLSSPQKKKKAHSSVRKTHI